jgi:hypothetical protein
MRRFVLGVSVALLGAGGVHAQSFTTGPCNGGEGEVNNGWFSARQVKVCEMRRVTLPMTGQVNVSGTNGGIEVVGEDRKDIALEAKVTAQDSSREKAEEILRQIQIATAGTIKADGPKFLGWFSHADWSVSYKLRVPRHLAADVTTVNGEVKVMGVDGAIHAATVNGGLSLADVAGDVHASTVNGGVHIALDGMAWRGAGLWAETVNGGISAKASDHYSAHLVVDTVNGDISLGFPVMVQGRLVGHHVDGNLGDGGSTIQFKTVNGGVSVEREQGVQ